MEPLITPSFSIWCCRTFTTYLLGSSLFLSREPLFSNVHFRFKLFFFCSPNLVTLTGTIAIFAVNFVILFFSPNYDAELPSWVQSTSLWFSFLRKCNGRSAQYLEQQFFSIRLWIIVMANMRNELGKDLRWVISLTMVFLFSWAGMIIG